MTLMTQVVVTDVPVELPLLAAVSDLEVVVPAVAVEDFYAMPEDRVVQMFDPLIHMLITRKLHGYDSSDVCEERDDIVQQCRDHILKAHRFRKFDPNRGAKFESYIYMLIDSRLGNYRNKVVRKNRAGTVNLTEINGWSIAGAGVQAGDDSMTRYPGMSGVVGDLSSVEDSIIERIDAQNLLGRLTGLKKILYYEYYVEGLSVLEIHERHPEIKYHKIRRELKLVMRFHDTLVRGE
jgi:hypothetical protein